MIRPHISKTDRRYTGWRVFKFVVTFNEERFKILNQREKFLLFQEVRSWCQQTWGESTEKELYLRYHETLEMNKHWSWEVDGYQLRLFLVDDRDRDWFLLRWS